MFTVLKKLFAAAMAIVVFFGSIAAAHKKPEPADEEAIRVSYGDGACENYDMFLPKTESCEVDVVFMIHGGAWLSGDQTMFEQRAKSAADKGYVGVTVDYSKLTEGATSADMVDEMYIAVASVKAKLAEFGYSADKMAVAGHSAGAHLALLYSYTHYSDSPIEIGFVCSSSAPSDFFDESADKSTTMMKYNYLAVSALIGEPVIPGHTDGTAEKIKANNPVDQVTASVPPTLISHGAKDDMVSYTNSVRLYERLQSVGVDSVFITYPNSDHFLQDDPQSNIEKANAFAEFAAKYL